MIEGLKIRLEPDELRAHCLSRAKYHTERADQKEKELPALRDALEKIKGGGGKAAESLARMSGKSGAYNLDTESPVEDLENDIRDHRNKNLVFLFYADHFIPEDYVLMEADLVRLEILKRW